ncbi:MAG: hypothetical protein K2X27_20195, partial [Candidatus Obscuribacterales bacterium]|nr:hypothetical protein [Candidatus Obscuribacterales bacterium]
MKERLGLLLLAALTLSACDEQNDANKNASSLNSGGRSFSVLAELRPKADPNVLRQMQQEEEAQRQAQLAEAERARQAQAQAQNQGNRQLPNVEQGSFAGNLPSVGGGMPDPNSQFQQTNQSWSAPPVASAPPPPPAAASYGINYTTPSPGFVPPPPAVSLSTSAMPVGYGAPPPDYNPYMNPYGYMQPQTQAPPQATRPKDSLFGAASSASASRAGDDDEDAPKKKKAAPMQIITPTGMEARSPYK